MADLASSVIYGYLQVNDSITANNLITAPKLTLTQATGTAPLTITSTTLVSNLNADLLDGKHASDFSLGDHNHTLDSLSNVTITSNATGEILKWNGTAWINNTLAEAGISATGHTHSYVPTTTNVTAGNGMTGGGALSGNITLTMGTPSSITSSSTNSVTSTSHTHAITGFSVDGHTHDYLATTGKAVDSDKLDGYDSATDGTVSTVPVRDSSGDITTRLFRSTFQNQATISGALAYRINTTDNYIRFCSDMGAVRTFIGCAATSHTHSYVPTTTNVTAGNGMTGGGALSGNITLTMGTPGDITSTSTNGVTATSHTHAVTSIDATKLTGTIADARLSGTYSGFTHKIDGSNTVYTTSSSGSSSTLARTVYGLSEYRSASSAQVGAIVFIAPNTTSTIMYQFEIAGMLYNQHIVSTQVQGYRTTGAWSALKKCSTGTVDVMVRFGVTPDGKNCLILGDVATSWSYPHISIIRAMFSHTNAGDAHCTGWTTAVVTDLSTYTNVTSAIEDSAMVGSITGNAATATKLATTRALTIGSTAKNFDGSAAVTWSLAEIGAAASSHTHTIANVTNLQTTLDGKAASSHTHTIANVTNLQTTLDGKAPIPTSSALPVGTICVCLIITGTVANGSTVSGSNLRIVAPINIDGTLYHAGATQSGTWKNIHGATVGESERSNTGLFVRTA